MQLIICFMKNLENYGVQEMSIKEQQEIDGGFLDILIGVIIGGIIAFGIWKRKKYLNNQ